MFHPPDDWQVTLLIAWSVVFVGVTAVTWYTRHFPHGALAATIKDALWPLFFIKFAVLFTCAALAELWRAFRQVIAELAGRESPPAGRGA